MNECVIILPTHSAYRDVCENFIKLYKRNWPDCKYKFVVSVCGEDILFEDTLSVYCGENATLLDCVRIVKEKFSAYIYFVFLGDAFLCSEVNSEEVELFINEIRRYQISYCRLYPQIMKSKRIRLGRWFRKINNKDRYAHSFIAFACTPDYIENEMTEGRSDFDYESKYLEEAERAENSYYYKDHVMLIKNIFHILPGIEKGKWDRLVLLKLKIQNPDINFCKRDKISYRWQIYFYNKAIAILRKRKRII